MPPKLYTMVNDLARRASAQTAAAATPASHSTDKTLQLKVTAAVLIALSLVVCGMRFYVRIFVLRSAGWDDFFAALGLAVGTLFSASIIVITDYGLGQHAGALQPEQLLAWTKWYYGSVLGYLYIFLFVKISILMFVLRTFPQKPIKRAVWGLLGFLIVFTLANSVANILQCIPVAFMWDKTIPGGKCWSNTVYFGMSLYQGVVLFITDVLILALPIKPLLAVQMPLGKRILLIGLCSLGAFACIASCVRWASLIYYKNSLEDVTYSSANAYTWLMVEYSLGLIAGSLPFARQLFYKAGFWSTKGSSAYNYNRSAESTGSRSRTFPLRSHPKHMYRNETLIEGGADTTNESQEHIINDHKISKTVRVTQEVKYDSRSDSHSDRT